MFFASELQISRVSVLSDAQGLFKSSKPLIRERKIALQGEHNFFGSAIRMKLVYASAVDGDVATLDVIRDSVTRLEEIERVARRVLGGAHPTTEAIEDALKDARAALRAREETQPAESFAEEVE